ncbi:MAG: DNA-binding protein [Chthoniobacteraceae bacterium]
MHSSFRTDEKTLAQRELQIERKQLTIEMRENFRGRFLRIVEKCGGKTNVVIIPDTGINDFYAALDEVIADTNAQPLPGEEG